MANDIHKIKLLLLWDILCKNTDEDHALNTDEIISLLAEKKIAVSRKILLQDIALLNEYGYEVLTYKKKYHYYYVVNRHFDSAEIAFLADAVQASKLSATQKQTLTNKLMTTMGDFQATELTVAARFGTMPKRNNRHIIYTIDTLWRKDSVCGMSGNHTTMGESERKRFGLRNRKILFFVREKGSSILIK